MQCLTELAPPTSVSHSLALSFTSSDSTNLVVAKTSLLQIFALKTVSTEVEPPRAVNGKYDADARNTQDDGLESSLINGDTLHKSEQVKTTKLVLVAEYSLSGTVTSMARVQTLKSKSGGDSLLLAFRDAKFSLVEWDPERHGLTTVSIHYYEQDDMDGSPWASSLSDYFNYIVADPASRCAALRFGSRNLAILPFHQGDEDAEMDDWDEELDGVRPTVPKVENDSTQDSPYATSFVLRMSSLDSNIIHPIHLAFLHEYREPTFGILSSTIHPTVSVMPDRKDHISYMVFTLDLQQKASTTILVVGGLPYDLRQVIPLPTPIGGALLAGNNELIHIDQSGKSTGVAVNLFAKQSTSFSLADQSDLGIRLDGCIIERLIPDKGEMIIILASGEIYILTFRMDGRSVSGLALKPCSLASPLISARPSCASFLGNNCVFVGCEDADSIVLGWSRKSKQTNRRKSVLDHSLDESDLDEDDDDDLYGDGPTLTSLQLASKEDVSNGNPEDYSFRLDDSLLNLGPLRDITFGKFTQFDTNNQEVADDHAPSLLLVGTSGSKKSGALVLLEREIDSKTVGSFDFLEARGIWTMTAKKPITKALQPDKGKVDDFTTQFDELMMVSKVMADSGEESAVYALTAAGFEALAGTEFEPAAGATLEAGTIGKGMRIIQVLRSEVRCYDGDFGLAQILPMFDEETGSEPKIISASIADPFLLLIRDDGSIFVANCDENDELEEMERADDQLLTNKWLSGCLYTDSTGTFAEVQTDRGLGYGENVIMCLLSAEGSLFIYSLSNLSKPVYIAQGISLIPSTISSAYTARRSTARETLTEILVADLGDSTYKTPYLLLRDANDDITIYEPFRLVSSTTTNSLAESLNFLKINNPHLAQNPNVSAFEETTADSPGRNNPMRAMANVSGYSTVFLPGASPAFIMRSASTMPKVIGLRGSGVRSMSGFHTAGCDRGFIYVDSKGSTRVSQLPSDTDFTQLGVPVRVVKIGSDIQGLAYNAPMDVYAIGTGVQESFDLPRDDDYHREWQKEDNVFKPTIEQGLVKLLSPETWSVIDTVVLEPGEMVVCMKTLSLEVSETTHERKPLIAVGTAIIKGEDLAVKGRVYVYDVVTVVPEPGRPETNKKLKLIAMEEIPRGAITALSEIGSQGFLLCAQGQKCMVRGIKEDGTLLPVAFMDMSTFVTSIKNLPGTGICVLADALKGIWLAGYAEDPYKMILFGKQASDMEVVMADLFPVGKELFIIVADSDCNLHVLQYDPEHPKSLQGQLLLHRTTFSLGGHLPTSMTLLPSTKAASVLPLTADAMDLAADDTIPEHEILITTSTGAMYLLSPLSEPTYRRLSTLNNHLSNVLYHAGGLNPKAYRVSSNAPDSVIGGRALVDGTLLMRWAELGSQRRAEVAARIGVDVQQLRDDLEGLRSGLLYF